MLKTPKMRKILLPFFLLAILTSASSPTLLNYRAADAQESELDTEAPVIVSSTVTPSTLSTGQSEFTVSVQATDNFGIDIIRVTLLTSPDGRMGINIPMTLQSGDAKSGTWTGTGTIPDTLPDGGYRFSMRVSDAARNFDGFEGGPRSPVLTVDRAGTEPPTDTEPPIVSGAADRNPDSNGFYTQPVTIEWQGVDTEGGSGVASCDSPTTYSSADAVNIGLSGSCTDNAGNTGTAAVTLNYDANSPTSTTISSNILQNGFASSNTITFALGGTDTAGVASYLCSIDGSGFVSCPTTVTYNGLSDGPHRFTAKAVDAAGHIDDIGADFSWTVDTIKPEVSVPANIVKEATSPSGTQVSYPSVKASDNLDGAITPTCMPQSGSMFPLGITIVVCSAQDRAGNQGSAPFGVTVQDTTPPDTKIASVKTGLNTITFTLTGTDAVGVKSFQCSFDKSAFSPCSGTATYNNIRAGAHIFAASAVDQSGNTDQSPATWAGIIRNK